MAQATKEELDKVSEQIFDQVFATEPGASNQAPQAAAAPNNDQNDKDKELEEMKKLLAAKDAQLAAIQKKLEEKEKSNDNNTIDGGDEDSKSPPKTDVTLSLRGTPEYDQYPYAMSADKFYFMASIKAPYFRSSERAAIDLIAVVDESGSMSGDRIKLVKETVQFIIKNLESSDRFGIVGYSSGSRIVLPLTKMDDLGKKSAQSLASGLRASGGTALCAGLVQGVNMMRQRKIKNDVASVMMLTDGQANEGPTSAQEINAAVLSGGIGGRSPAYSQQQRVPAPPQKKKLFAKKKRKKKPSVPVQLQGIEEKEIEGSTKGKGMGGSELPCTINTFGFGAGHNESLLESIAENGRGMYAFIQNTDMIADTFAECLGGLVSIIGQNLKVSVEALNDVSINKCLSDGYTININKPNKMYTISINNLQSEENRDLIFELKVPQLSAAKDGDPIIQLGVKYKNVVRNKDEVLSNVCRINRIEGKQIGERNIELDIQYNRVLAANAMEEADELANKGKLNEARQILTNAQKHIQKSQSNKNKFSKALVDDIQIVQNNMQNKQQYRSHGGKMLKMNKKAHKMQRSVQSSAYASQNAYQNRSKSGMKKKFKSSK